MVYLKLISYMDLATGAFAESLSLCISKGFDKTKGIYCGVTTEMIVSCPHQSLTQHTHLNNQTHLQALKSTHTISKHTSLILCVCGLTLARHRGCVS